MRKFVSVIFLSLISLVVFETSAQEAPQSVPLIKPDVPENYSLYKKTVWRRMDLKEKQNKPFNSTNGEISRLLIEAVNEGLLRPYGSDSCINFMPDIQFQSNISVEREENPFIGGDFSFDDQPQDNGAVQEDDGPKRDDVPPELFSVLYLREEVIFDRNRSRMYNYIQSIALYLPASVGTDWNPGGFEKPVGFFKYDDVVELFKTHYADKAIWYNVQNQASHLNFADAFELRLFSAPIVQISNADDLDIRQEYGDLIQQDPMNALIIQQKYEYDLMEYEAELWEY